MSHKFEQQESTHLIFDGSKIIVSPDITPVMNFLMEIEKEINSLLGFQKKLKEIRKQYLETIKLLSFLDKKVKDRNIEFEHNLEESPEATFAKFDFYLPIRSQMIALFASLEVLYLLHIAYVKEIDNEDEIKEVTKKDKILKKFINSFLLTEENSYYKNNKNRLSRIDSKMIRDLRNSLTHFFSLPANGLSIAPSYSDKKARKIENLLKQNKHGNIVFVSSEDLHKLIGSAHMLRIIKWNDDFNKDRNEFKRKFKFVISLVEKHGAVPILDKQLNI